MTDPTNFSQLAKYKERVRVEALRVAQEMGWCRDGLNETLIALDLEPVAAPISVPVRFTNEAGKTKLIRMEVEAGTFDEAVAKLLADAERTMKFGQRRFSLPVTEFEIAQEPTQPEAGTGVPLKGDPTPAEGDWYATRVVEGGPNQCRVPNDFYDGLYCTRPVGHDADWHVAAGKNAGVLAVFPAKDGDVRPDAARFADLAPVAAGISMDDDTED